MGAEMSFDAVEYKPIEGYDGKYIISNDGKIYNTILKEFLK